MVGISKARYSKRDVSVLSSARMRVICSSIAGAVVNVYRSEMSIADDGCPVELAASCGLKIMMALETNSCRRRNVCPSSILCSAMLAEIPLSQIENCVVLSLHLLQLA